MTNMKGLFVILLAGLANGMFPNYMNHPINILWKMYTENYQRIHYNETIDDHLLIHTILG
jgi:hypothetical protein